MQDDTITIVVATQQPIYRQLIELINKTLRYQHGLEVEVGPKPGMPTFVGAPGLRNMHVTLTEHMVNRPLQMDVNHLAVEEIRICPPVATTVLGGQDGVQISVIGAVHSGKSSVMQALRQALIEDGMPPENIRLCSFDPFTPDFSIDEIKDCIARMSARKVHLLFMRAARMGYYSDMIPLCGIRNTAPQQT
ncbi:hypothetical protein D3C85_838110 [compost metagenome]